MSKVSKDKNKQVSYPGVKPAISKKKNPETGISEEVILPGKWRVFMCYTVNGVTHRDTKVIEAKTAKQAYDYKVLREKELVEEAKLGYVKSKADKMTFTSLVKEWKTITEIDIANGDFSPTTYATYKATLDKYLIPYFGDMIIGNINSVVINNYRDYIKREYSLSDKTLYNQLMELRGILGYAEYKGWLVVNPFEKRSKRSRRDKIKLADDKKDIECFTDQQMINILHKLDQDVDDLEKSFSASIKYSKLDKKEAEARQNLRRLDVQMKRLFVQLAIVTGARRGELCGLRWSDLDDVSMVIGFKGSSYTLAGSKTTKKNTLKNGSSSKSVSLNASIIPVIDEYRKLQAKVRRQQGWPDNGYIFTAIKNGKVNKAGDMVRGDTFTQWFAGWCENNADDLGLSEAEAKEAHVHMLRHSSISLLLNSNMPIKAVADRAGHSDTRVTTKIYGHTDKGTSRVLANTFDSLYESKSLDNNSETVAE